MKLQFVLLPIVFAFALGTAGMSEDQEQSVVALSSQIIAAKMGTVKETRLFRTLAIALNDRTAMEAMLTDPDSAAYKAGLISLAQAIKVYAWIGRDDQLLLQSLQPVANRLRDLLTK
ncbi:hypothetical protein GGI02_002506 [Coemansia sp. RSA 2322]|uniref:Uncharacterized protein n=1 Tax=Coemansia thaxteri TaxID=2663907 RepID=A0A9W8BHH9_9FUNG|nr:hypothetical protein H4R26_003765 [Coemansia thaxteri]KAJ2471091.1 hypothetical protein GGI02_002506 [Coemansia sp. RSA 2322]KAJ2481952.1 hypothetical protein EV174_003346 [Coemansia sp. RSA 2320]